MSSTSFLSSIAAHLALGAGLWLFIQESPQVAGADGLRGSPTASLLIEMSSPSAVTAPPAMTAAQAVTEKPEPKHVAQTSDGVVIAKAEPATAKPVIAEPAPEAEQELAPELATELPTETKAEAQWANDHLNSQQARAVPNEDVPGERYGSRGQGGSSDVAADRIGNSTRTNEIGLYLAKVHQRIQKHLRSPGTLSTTRTAEMRIHILQNGEVSAIEVRKSSGDRKLDLLAIDAVRRAQPFDRATNELRVNIPVVFRIDR